MAAVKLATGEGIVTALKDPMPSGMALRPDGSSVLLNSERGILVKAGLVAEPRNRASRLISERAIAVMGKIADLITAPQAANEKVLR